MEAIDHYFCIISEHNIAEFSACLHLKPKHIHLIVSNSINIQNAADRFIRTWQQKTNLNNIHKVTGQNHLNVDSIADIQQWIENDFKPYLVNTENSICVLNITGGTKILPLLLVQSYPWSKLHYQAFTSGSTQNTLQVFTIKDNKIGNTQEIPLDDKKLGPIDAVKLYANTVRVRTEANPIIENPLSLELAKMQLEAQLLFDKKTSENLFTIIKEPLQNFWFPEEKENKKKYDLLSWSSFECDKTLLIPFLEKLFSLCELPTEVQLTNDGVSLMQDKDQLKKKNMLERNASYWQKWISGEWYEQLIYHWLCELGISPKLMTQNLSISRKDSNGQELDIVLLKNNQVHILEIKSDINPPQELKHFRYQLNDQASEIGKIKKVLILSPLIKYKNSQNTWDDFVKNCKDTAIQIIIADNKESLKEIIK